MANTPKKSESKALVPQVLPSELVNIAVNLDKDDVAAILMSRAEEYIKGAIKDHKKTERSLGKESQKLCGQLEEQMAVVAATHFEVAIATLKEAAKGLKVKEVEAFTEATSQHFRDNGHGVVCCSLNIAGIKPAISWNVRQEVKMPANIKETLEAQKANVLANSANNDAWMLMRRKLDDLPSLERRAKAAVAEQRLSATDEGKALVAMLEAKLEDSIDLLG